MRIENCLTWRNICKSSGKNSAVARSTTYSLSVRWQRTVFKIPKIVPPIGNLPVSTKFAIDSPN